MDRTGEGPSATVQRARVGGAGGPARDGTHDARGDAELLVAIGAGDEGALYVLYRRHAPTLLARLSSRCSDLHLVEEAVQETFVAVWRAPGAWRGDGLVAAWLWGIAIRRLIDRLRRRPAPRRATVVEVAPSAEEHALASVEFGDLAGALAHLSPELLAVIQATVLDGLTAREAARLLGVPVGTVKTRLMRARKQLREVLA